MAIFVKILPVLLLAIAAVSCSDDNNNRLDCILTGKHCNYNRHNYFINFWISINADTSTISESACISKGCHVDKSATNGAPWCFLDDNIVGYTVSQTPKPHVDSKGIHGNLLLKPDAYRSTNFEQIYKLNISVNYLSDNILRIKITDANKKRYEVPIQDKFNIPNGDVTNPRYLVNLTTAFNLTVTRKDSNVKM